MMVKFGKIMSYLVENTVEIEDKSHEEEDNGESEELAEDLEFESGVGIDALFHVTYAEKNSITNINETIKKIRNVVKLFRKSPIKNDIVQKYVKEEFGCEKMVCLDTKTRWNSLLAMLEIFLEIKSAISKALIDIKEEQMGVNVEFETVTTIVKGLKPVKIGLEKLCSRNATLLTAEGVFSFVIGELNKQNSEFAKNMKYSLIQRINERRNVNLIGLMQYLNFGRKYEAAAVTGDISRLPGKNCLVRQAQMIGTRLFCEEEESISNFSHSEEESIEILKEKPLALDEKLEKAIYSKTKVLYCSTTKKVPVSTKS
ncbi:uncharacterized protein TNCV_3216671 [Trichonephila clavipes]|nr:uncharacterized protein TNCV_3216671 [Trichonephila clavipes]